MVVDETDLFGAAERGSRLEPGEPPYQAAARELREEIADSCSPAGAEVAEGRWLPTLCTPRTRVIRSTPSCPARQVSNSVLVSRRH
jgi:hypothetical protein